MNKSAYSPSELLDTVLKRLKENGGRMTKKREQSRLMLTFDRPASAEEIRKRAELSASDL